MSGCLESKGLCTPFAFEMKQKECKSEFFGGQSQKTDLTETEVIIIGVICAVILLSLIIVLIVIICRRRTNAKDYGNSSTTVSRPVPNLQTNGNSVGPPKPQRGPDNQGSPSTPRKDPHHFLEAQDRKDLSKGGQESGYSTPEGQQQKPKKVIYEVVV
uniref:Uncharacterized protein n=1 Tax=Magallana gigas TaxID=29159 RepID=K1QUJ4_MAGGI